jgi:hypothetical protein
MEKISWVGHVFTDQAMLRDKEMRWYGRVIVNAWCRAKMQDLIEYHVGAEVLRIPGLKVGQPLTGTSTRDFAGVVKVQEDRRM